MTLRLLQRDHRPADMGHYLPIVDGTRIDPATGGCLVTVIERCPRRDAAGFLVVRAEAPASGAEPSDIRHRIAPGAELPIEDGRQAAFVHEIVPCPEILMDEN